MSKQDHNLAPPPQTEADEDRRKFLASCGKFALVTPPAIAILLSTSLNTCGHRPLWRKPQRSQAET